MLKKFKVKNFRGFKDKVVLDLTSTNSYMFNKELVKDGLIKNGLLYGINGSGKSNLGFALSDIVKTLTDLNISKDFVECYNKNYDSDEKMIIFSYEFLFGKDDVIYEYGKSDIQTLVYEKVIVNNKQVLYFSFDSHNSLNVPELDYDYFSELKGLDFSKLNTNRISILKYVSGFVNLENNIIGKIINFANHFLWFRSLSFSGNDETGIKIGIDNIASIIVRNKKLDDFQKFLCDQHINYRLDHKSINGSEHIFVKFKNTTAEFFDVASRGTAYLALFYSWLIEFKNISFLFIDEFDSYYHYETAANVFKIVSSFGNIQSILTTHNTYLMKNDITRPDCVFLIKDSKCVKSLPNYTDLELREAHNIEKLYRGGAFSE